MGGERGRGREKNVKYLDKRLLPSLHDTVTLIVRAASPSAIEHPFLGVTNWSNGLRR